MSDVINLFTNASAADHGRAAAFALGWAVAILLTAFIRRHTAQQEDR